MPAKRKLSFAQKAKLKAKDDAVYKKMAQHYLGTEAARTSSDGKTKIWNNTYMINAKGEYFKMETERRSKNVLIMKWRKL